MNVRKSLFFSLLQNYSTTAIQFFASIILARILSPEEIGIYSVGIVIIGFAHTLRDFGITNYLIQAKSITKEDVSTSFTITLLIAWLLAGILVLCSGYISRFYEQPGIKQIIYVISINFLFLPIGSTVLALLRRQLNFRTIFKINLIGTLANNVTILILALNNYGFMSMAWGSLIGTIVTILLAIKFYPQILRTSIALQSFKKVFKFGSVSTLASIITDIGLNTPDLIIGKLLGFSSVGYYSRGMGLTNIFNQIVLGAISPVILPAFAAKNRSGEDIKTVYLKVSAYITAIAWPCYAFLAIFAQPIIRVLYGNQWDNAVTVSQILCLAFSIRSLNAFDGQILISLGKVNQQLLSQILLQPIRFIATVIACNDGLVAAASVQVIFYIITFFVFHCLLHKTLKIKIRNILFSIIKSLLITCFCIIALYIFYKNITYTQETQLIYLLMSSMLFIISWLFTVYLTSHILKQEIQVLIRKIFN